MSESSPDTAAAPEPEVHGMLSKLFDFPDRISPMIVKELRQGMRTRAFTGIFLILQVILGFAMFFALSSDSGNIGRDISRIVFFLFSFVALILQPLRGTTAVATELKENTLELMSLTRLSSFRIVFGKWASIVSQTALMLSATVPYLVMRYFFGGMQLFSELALLFAIFILSISLTGLTVGLSCNRAMLIRSLVPLVLIPVGFSVLSGLFFGGGGYVLDRIFSFEDKEMNIVLGLVLGLSLYVGYYFLDMGVSRIAALAENHAFRKRLISLSLMTLALVAICFTEARVGAVFVVLLFSILIGIDVCSETAVAVPSVVQSFVKRGVLGKMMGRFLYPGWHTGLIILTVLFGLALLVGEYTFPDRDSYYDYIAHGGARKTGLNDELTLSIFGIFYCILMPLLLLRLFKHRVTNNFTGYIGMVLGSGIATLLIVILAEGVNMSDALYLVFLWIPGVWIMVVSETSDAEFGIVLQGALLVIVWGILVIWASREFKNTRALEARARADSEE